MGIVRKRMSGATLGAVDFRSDKDRTAAYTKGARKQAKKQTKIIKSQAKQQQSQNAAMLAQATLAAQAPLMAQQSAQAPSGSVPPQPVVPQAPSAGWYPDQVNPAVVRWFVGSMGRAGPSRHSLVSKHGRFKRPPVSDGPGDFV